MIALVSLFKRYPRYYEDDYDINTVLKTLAPWKKAMTNLDGVLKNKDITLPTRSI